MYKNIGHILLELMIASILGLAILHLLFTSVISHQDYFNQQIRMNSLMDGATQTISILNTEIHKAGHKGCKYVLNNIMGTDTAIKIQYAAENGVRLIRQMVNNTHLKTSDNICYPNGSEMLITDCEHVEVFKIKNGSCHLGSQTINIDGKLQYLYGAGSYVSRFESNNFYIAHSSLYVDNKHQTRMRLIDGIEDLKFHYVKNGTKIIAVSYCFVAVSQNIRKKWYSYVAL